MSYTKKCSANRTGFGPVMAKVSSPYLLDSYCNLNCIKDLSVILIFVIPAGRLKCIKEHLPQQEILRKSNSAKVLNSDLYLCPPSKLHLQNCLIDSKDFLTKNTQGIHGICESTYGLVEQCRTQGL